jgi:hypothetical protein
MWTIYRVAGEWIFLVGLRGDEEMRNEEGWWGIEAVNLQMLANK